MQSLFALITCALAVASASTTNTIIKSKWGTQYIAFGAGYETSFDNALENCKKLGENWTLATVKIDREKNLLASHILQESYIARYTEENYRTYCLALQTNGVVTVATKKCTGPVGYICEAPESACVPAGY